MKKVSGRSALVLDLRGNPGGRLSTVRHFIGYFFKEDVQIAERRSRKEREVLTSKSHGRSTFTGKLVVIVDSQSGSGAEVFARTVQLQKRGIVVGDRSAGAVMVSQRLVHRFKRPPSDDWVFDYFGASITIEDLIMPDKRSLEHVGVTPDLAALPTSTDLAQGKDPVLAKAVQLVGGHLDGVQAGLAFGTP